MNRKLISSLFGLALAHSVVAQPAQYYINDAVVISPPQIDAINFVNNNYFDVGTGSPYETSDTLNYTNRGAMIGYGGFLFDTAPTSSGQRRMAANFVNAPLGPSPGSISTSGASLSQILIWATNIFNRGTVTLGPDSLFRAYGKNVNFTNGGIVMEGAGGVGGAGGVFNTYWSVTNNTAWNPYALLDSVFMPPTTPPYYVTNAAAGRVLEQLQLNTSGATYTMYNNTINDSDPFNPYTTYSNFCVQIVFLSQANSSPPINTRVFFFPAQYQDQSGLLVLTNTTFPLYTPDGLPLPAVDLSPSSNGVAMIEWSSTVTNPVTGVPGTKYIYLLDTYGGLTNNALYSNYVSGTFSPTNYTVFSSSSPFTDLYASGPTYTPGFFPFEDGFAGNTGLSSSNVNSQITALGLLYTVTTEDPAALVGGAVSNFTGRAEITADNSLDLARARIIGPNYLLLKSTNHFAGNNRAQISAPYNDLYLGSTNGNLAITNLVPPFVPGLNGSVDIFSARWTNTWLTTELSTNALARYRYSVLFVNSDLQPTVPAYVENLQLRSPNVVVSDTMNIQQSLLIDATNLILTANGPGAATPWGVLNYQNSASGISDIVWSTALPHLQNLTNNGTIQAGNAIFFGGARTSPYYSQNTADWYSAFVNRGLIYDYGTYIYADYFDNEGSIECYVGGIVIQGQSVLLNNGYFLSGYAGYYPGEVSILCTNLVAQDQYISTAGAVTLAVTNAITDNASTLGGDSYNSWYAGNGFNLLYNPTNGDLLGTTVNSFAPEWAEADSFWAGVDLGNTPDGFVNNVAIGHLILDGLGADSLFTFNPVNLVLAFDDHATSPVPGDLVPPGTYQPTDYVPGRPMLTNGMPANIRALLSLPYGTSLAALATNNPNGNWLLFVDRATNNMGSEIDWGWSLAFGVLSSNYVITTNITLINGAPASTNVTTSTNYLGANPAFTGGDIVLPAGVYPGGAFAQPYPATNSVSLSLRTNQAVTSFFTFTNRVGVDVFVTNQTQRVFTTDRVTNAVALLSTPAVVDAAYMDVLLVGPNGNKVKLMGGAGELATNRCALYVDLLELQDYATNMDGGDLTEVQVNPNIRIYFAAAVKTFWTTDYYLTNDDSGNQYYVTNTVRNIVPISDTLGNPNANGGRFGWVPDYAGYFSKLSLGKTPPSMKLSVAVSSGPAPSALVSWNSMANATNSLYFKTSPASTNWQLLTNFISSPLGGTVTVADPISSITPRFYRVRMDPKQP